MYIEVLHVKGVIVSQQELDVSAKWLIGMHTHQLDTFYATRSGLKSVTDLFLLVMYKLAICEKHLNALQPIPIHILFY